MFKNKMIICLMLLCGCSTTKHLGGVNPDSPGDFELGMSIEDFKHRNLGLSIYRAIADTVIYTRLETPNGGETHQIGYIFFNGKLFEVKRLALNTPPTELIIKE